ncbi:MAG: hypothetical protein CME70_07070 [Halobacteriovorax sp.]|nr:hypothetical protein [Halobacteriovorax sp.]|tara:strand:- start:428224 stop:428844 length:621 start_codon:yes stop_codon:yes gene_type:complete
MALITVNQEEINLKTQANQTVNELIDNLLSGVIKDSEVITSIQINGRQLNEVEEGECLPSQLSEFNNIDFTVKSSIELAFEALESCSSYIDVVINKIQELNKLYASGELQSANSLFAEVIEIMDLFVQLMSKIHSTLRANLGDKFEKTQTLQNLEIHLLSILKGLVPAKEKNDIIMLCDLLEYELIDNLTQWKIKAIPELKNLKEV